MLASSLFRNRNFRLHWGVIAISSTGGYFTLVALPWLALALSHNSPLVVTTLLACTSLPQGCGILFGGGLADRFSAYRTLWTTRLALAAVLFALAAVTWLTVFPLWLLYIFAFGLGSLAAIATPASQALLPQIVAPEELPKANGFVIGTFQLSQIVGPIAAGCTIWLVKRALNVPENQTEPRSIALAFAVEGSALILATALLAGMRVKRTPSKSGDLLKLIRDGVRFCWSDADIRLVLGYLLLISFFVQGPLLASLPLFTKFTLGLSERTYGTLYGTLGCGTILGAGLAAWWRPSAAVLGRVVLCCDLTVGVALYSFSGCTSAWSAGASLLLMGLATGVTSVAGVSWFQQRTPGEYMGRTMGLLMFSICGFIPVSATLTGYLISLFNISEVMRGASIIIALCTIAGLAIPRVRDMGRRPRAQKEPISDELTLEPAGETPGN